jgi:hypothetical protein
MKKAWGAEGLSGGSGRVESPSLQEGGWE